MSTPDSTASLPWHNNFFAVLPDATGVCVLLLPGDDGWSLPHVQTTDTWLAEIDKVVPALRTGLGLGFDFTILRYITAEADSVARQDRIVFVLEPATPLNTPPLAGQWFDAAALADLHLAWPDQRTPLLRYLAEIRGEVDAPMDPRRPPWAHPGWFAAAAAWTESALAAQDYTQTGPVEQVRSWSLSCLLRVPTTQGHVYFKVAAHLPLFVNEAALVATLAMLYPSQVPAPIQIDRARRWMLTDDFGLPIREDPAADRAALRAPVLARFAHLQQAAADHLDALADAGCIDRRLPALATQIDPLLADPTTRAALSATDYAALVAFAPDLRQRCTALAAYNLPATLVHGDLHFGNVARRDGDFVFFDWTDACISFPFFDLIEVYFFIEDEAARVTPRNAYLDAWTAYESPARLREAWELAKPLCALHHAVSYLTLINHLEPHTRDEIAHGLTDNLVWLLAALRG